MTNFSEVEADLKKQFLSALIRADFECSAEVYDSQIGERVKNISAIHRVATHILHLVHENDKKQTEELLTQIEKWVKDQTPIDTLMIWEARKTLSKLISTNFYGNLNIKVVPTSAIEQTKEAPKPKPYDYTDSGKL